MSGLNRRTGATTAYVRRADIRVGFALSSHVKFRTDPRPVGQAKYAAGPARAAVRRPRGTAEQHIKKGKNAINWTRLSCHGFRNNQVGLQLHVLAYNMVNFVRTLALRDEVKH
ncbi:MAG: transposase [Proteobacteria bacterium]|nr:transposase [Pseudomonadota bacterium]